MGQRYEPFGSLLPGRNYSSSSYRFGFNGMEKDDEVHGSTGTSYDYGARMRDPRVGPWLSLDPLAIKYPGLSPYAFVGNMVIAAKDPDGRKILFINGYYSTIVGGLIGASTGGKNYWGAGFATGAQRFFKDNAVITAANYIDGSSAFGGDMSGQDRFDAGYAYAKAQLTTLTADMVEGETFKLVTHSEGAAYGAGMAQYLIEQGHKVETVVHLSADEGDEFSTPTDPVTYQMGYRGDWLTGNLPIEGVDKSGEVIARDAKGKELGTRYVHGSTKGARVWGELEDLKGVQLQENIGMHGKNVATWRTQVDGSAPNGTDFQKVNGREVSDDEGYRKK